MEFRVAGLESQVGGIQRELKMLCWAEESGQI